MNDSEQGFERAVIARDHKKMCQAGFIMFVTVLSMAGRGSIRFCALISTMGLYEIGRLVKLVRAKILATQCRASARRDTAPADSFHCTSPAHRHTYIRSQHGVTNIGNFFMVSWDSIFIVAQKSYWLVQIFHESYIWMVISIVKNNFIWIG